MQLPTRHTDETSDYYTPEHLRGHYEKLPPVPLQDHAKVMENYAKAKAGEYTTPGESATDYWARVDRLIAECDLSAALHTHYIMEAQKRYNLFTRLEEKREQRHLESVCPVCGEHTLETPDNPLDRRSLTLERIILLNKPQDFYSCLKCYLTAVQLYTEQAAKEKIGRKTRHDLVTKALTSK